MRYAFQIHMTDEDYTAFNLFHSIHSSYFRQSRRRLKGFILVLYALTIVFNFWREGVSAASVSYGLLLALIGGVLVWKFDRLYAVIIRSTVKGMKKSGKMPFSPDSRVELYDDKIVEITPEQRTERTWDSMERLCLVGGRYWYLYINNSAAFIFPVEQLREQTDIGELYRFVESKCPVVERYE